MELRGEAHGKLLLFGEHAVVYGHPALGLTLPLTTRLSLVSSDQIESRTDVPLIEHMLPHLGKEAQRLWESHHWQAEIVSDVPIGGGLGSSAALTGALARALGKGLNPPPSEETVWQMAHRAERVFHGRPSGVDTTLALGSGLTAFDPHGPRFRTCLTEPFALVTGVVPRQSNSKALIQRVHQATHAPEPSTQQHIERLGRLSAEVITGLNRGPGDISSFLGHHASDAHEILRDLGLSTPALDHILTVGRRAGASGGKLSGAGGGGAWLLICADRTSALNVARALREQGLDGGNPLWTYQWMGRDLLEA